MGPLDLISHLLGFAAPAFFVAVLVALFARWLRLSPPSLRWWVQAAINFTAGLLALLAGLWAFGVDGKMASYAALIAAVATTQWLAGRG